MEPNNYQIPDPCERVGEPRRPWGSDWTDQKLNAFEKYVRAYLTILNKKKHQFNWKTIYFDGFAGSGDRGEGLQDEIHPEDSLFDLEDLDEIDSQATYRGAAERVLSISDMEPFDKYIFIDKDQHSIESLERSLRDKGLLEGRAVQFKRGDANEELNLLADYLDQPSHRYYRALVLLDPFGMQLDWESIERISKFNCDIWVLVPSGVIINRLIKRDGELRYPEKLTRYFGLTEDEIKDLLYEKTRRPSLFGDEDKMEKIKDTIGQIAKIYIARLKTVMEHVTEEPLILYNQKKVPIYHFVFASKYSVAERIASQIVAIE